MAGFRKRGMQSPWLQVLLGSAAGAMQNIKEERDRQNEYARKVALMNVEQVFKTRDRSQEQELANTRLQETRAYSEKQTQEQRQYTQQQKDLEQEQARQQRIVQYDPTGQVAEIGKQYAEESGEEKIPGGSAIEEALAKALSEAQSINNPGERIQAIERYNPAMAVGNSKFVNKVFYDALKPYRQAAEKALDSIERANGMIAVGAEPGQELQWWGKFQEVIKGSEWTSQYQDLIKRGSEVLTKQRSQKPEKPEQTAAEKEAERIAASKRDLAEKNIFRGPLDVEGKTETLQQLTDRTKQENSALAISLGAGNAADSTMVGIQPSASGRQDMLSGALSGSLSPDQLAGLRAQGQSPGAAAPQQLTSALPGQGAMPPAYAAALGQPPPVQAAGAMITGVPNVPTAPTGYQVMTEAGDTINVGPLTRQALQLGVTSGQFKTETDALQFLLDNRVNTSL